MKFIRVGKIVNTHGLDGELVLQFKTESPQIFDDMQYMMLAREGEVKASLEIEFIEDFKGNALVGFVGIEDIDAAKKYKGMDVVVPEEIIPEAEEGAIYWYDLVGCPVFDINGEEVGSLADYMEAGGTEVFRIKCEDGFYLISNNINHVLEINVKDKKLVIDRIGLVSEEI